MMLAAPHYVNERQSDRDWADIAHLPLSHDERVALRAHIEQCVEDLKELNDRLDAMVERPT